MMNKIQKKLKSMEIKARKILQRKRGEDTSTPKYYIQVENESACGKVYVNTIPLHKYGKVAPFMIDNQAWFYLVNKAKEKAGK